jgi:hypothetical protein
MDLSKIRKGILKNLAVKNPHTLEVNSVIEGNSYFGLCIFIGLGLMFGHSHKTIAEYLSEDVDHVKFLEEKFISILSDYFNTKKPTTTAKGFYTKTSLVLNFINNNYGKKVSLAEVIKDKIK